MKWLTILACLVLVFGPPSQLTAASVISVTVSPNPAQVSPGAQVQFSAAVTGTSNSVVIWSVTGAGCSGIVCGQITGTGLYTAPATVPSPNTVTVKATSLADSAVVGTATVTIQAVVKVLVTVTPTLATLAVGGQQQFSASVTGTSNTGVTWKVSGTGCVGNSCGTITSAGLYTAPATVPNPSSATITATSVADTTKSASALVVIQSSGLISVTVSPNPAQVSAGGQVQFKATVSGATNTAVTWSVSGAGCSGIACGTITANGLYTAPGTAPNPAAVTVRATSVAAPSQSGTATVGLGAAVTVAISPTSTQVRLGGQVPFTATVTGTSNTLVLWSVSGAGCSGITCGTVTGGGLYTAPALAPNPPIVTVTATLLADASKSASATVTLGSGTLIGITISPTSVQLVTGAQKQFQTAVTGTANTGVTWSVSGVGCAGATCGTITTGGLYTAPATVPNPSLVTVIATSQADTTKSASATVTLSALITVTVSPTPVQVAPSTSQQFTAKVTGSLNTSVTWTLSGSGCAGVSCGTINAAGLYFAPALVPIPPTVTVTATSQADLTKSGSATVTVLIPISVTISPTSVGVTVGARQQFATKVAGTSNTAVTWTVSGAGCAGTACGTITTAGLYVAPATIPSPATVTVTATSQANPSKAASAVVTIQPTNNSKLSNLYAFLFKGFDILGPYQVAGSFQSDGDGHLTGVEDINRATGPAVNVPFTGTYQVGGDSRGTMTLTSAKGTTTFAFALGPTAKKGRLIAFDNSGIRGSGILRQQDPSAFNTFALANGYTLNLTGLDWLGGRVGALASIFPSGFNFVAGSAMDISDNGSAQAFTSFNGGYTMASNGRGTLTLNVLGFGNGVLNFAVYVVSAQELILVSIDQLSPFNPIFAGLAEQQTGSPFLLSSFRGFSVFNLAGFNSIGEAFVGRMSFDGLGLVTVQFDENKAGVITIAGGFTGTYAVAPNGRGTLTLTNNETHSITTWMFYAIAPNRAFLMDSPFLIGIGEMKKQLVSLPFNNADLVGDFVQGSGEASSINADVLAGVSVFDGTAITGAQNLSQISGLTPDQTLGGIYQVSFVSNNGRGTILLTSPGSSTIALWLISSSEFVALDVDGGNLEPTVLFFEQ